MALEQFPAESSAGGGGRPIDLVRDLLGSHESGIPDLGQSHREQLRRQVRRRSEPAS